MNKSRFCGQVCRLTNGRPEHRIPLYTDKTPGQGPKGDCWEWIGRKNPWGRGIMYFDGKSRFVTREAWKLENGSIPEGLFACHTCDNPSCVRVSHLFLGTYTDNMQDCIKKGRFPFKAMKENAISRRLLNPVQIRAIKDVYSKGKITMIEIGRLCGVGEQAVRRILHGETYKDLGPSSDGC